MGMVTRGALISKQSGLVENIIVVDENFVPDDGYFIIPNPDAGVGIGMIYDHGNWLPPSREPITIDELRTQGHTIRYERRLRAKLGGFIHAGHLIDSDRDSVLRITNATASALSSIISQQFWSTVWRCADEYNLPLDAHGMLAMQGDLVRHGQACHIASQAISTEIEAATSINALDAIIAAIPNDPRWPA